MATFSIGQRSFFVSFSPISSNSGPDETMVQRRREKLSSRRQKPFGDCADAIHTLLSNKTVTRWNHARQGEDFLLSHFNPLRDGIAPREECVEVVELRGQPRPQATLFLARQGFDFFDDVCGRHGGNVAPAVFASSFKSK